MNTHRADLKDIARRAMVERGLWPDFSPRRWPSWRAFQRRLSTDRSDIRDLTGLLWASIDNDDSRDLDQLTVAEPLAGRSVRILVAVADVDALVRRTRALDAHASHNTTSVYTPGDIFPMLPEKLSTDLTSLNEGQDRLAVVAEMVFETTGRSSSRPLSGPVRNHGETGLQQRRSVARRRGLPLERSMPSPGLDAQLRLQDQVAQRLKARDTSRAR